MEEGGEMSFSMIPINPFPNIQNNGPWEDLHAISGFQCQAHDAEGTAPPTPPHTHSISEMSMITGTSVLSGSDLGSRAFKLSLLFITKQDNQHFRSGSHGAEAVMEKLSSCLTESTLRREGGR